MPAEQIDQGAIVMRSVLAQPSAAEPARAASG
jgi:hypothetical protein